MCDAYCTSGAHESLSSTTSSLWVPFCAWQYYCNVNVNSCNLKKCSDICECVKKAANVTSN